LVNTDYNEIMTQLYIDLKYAKILGSRLPNFKARKSDSWAFSHTCETPKPGRTAKTRGCFFVWKNSLIFKCHHCGASSSFATFLKETVPTLHDEYRLEIYRDRVDSDVPIIPKSTSAPVITKEPPREDDVLRGLYSLSSLATDHPAVKYATRRAIPREHFDRIYFCRKIYEYASRWKPELNTTNDHPRLVFPYYDANDRVYAFTARAFGKEEPKYLFIKTDENMSRIYGLWRINPEEKIIALEGQIDSLCLDNAIAVGGADYSDPILKQLQSNLVIVPDNDFVRNRQVSNQIDRAISMGYTISLMPDGVKYKDINDAVKMGYNPAELRDVILKNAKRGLEAKLELIHRRKR